MMLLTRAAKPDCDGADDAINMKVITLSYTICVTDVAENKFSPSVTDTTPLN